MSRPGGRRVGRGDLDVPAMAAWCHENLTDPELAEFAERLLRIGGHYPQNPDTPAMFELAGLLIE